MFSSLLACVAANLFAGLGAWGLAVRLRTSRDDLNLLLFGLCLLLLQSAITLACGLAGLLSPAGLCAAAAASAALRIGARGKLFDAPRAVFFPPLPAFLALVLLLRLLVQAWVFAPYLGDVLSYHLPKVAEWVGDGGFGRELGPDSHSTFPAGFELIEAWWVALPGHDAAIEAAGLQFLALGAVAVAVLSRDLGVPPVWALGAGLLYVLCPGPHFQATACMNDGPVAALALASFALIGTGASTSLAALPIALGLGLKPSMAYVLPGLLLFRFLCRPTPSARSPAAAAATALALLVAFYWYLRNWAWFGNPIHPVSWGGYQGQSEIQFGPGWTSLWRNVSALPGRLADAAGPGALLFEGAGWGVAATAVGLPALVVAVKRDPRWRRAAVAFALSVLSCLSLVLHDPWSLRFILFAPGLLCAAAASLASEKRFVRLLLGLAAGIGVLHTFVPRELPGADARVLASVPWRERSARPLFGLEPLPEGGVACVTGNEGVPYLLYRPDFSGRVAYLRPRNAAELATEMRRLGLRVLYLTEGSEERRRLLADGLRDGTIRPLRPPLYRVD